MNIKNTTEYPDYFLSRMLTWVCRELELPRAKLTEASFCNRNDGLTSGRAWYPDCRIHVSLGVVRWFKDPPQDPEIQVREVRDDWGKHSVPIWPSHLRTRQVDDLVRVTAHECFHVYAYVNDIRTRRIAKHHRPGSSEPQTRWHERQVLRAFQAQREELLARWMRKPSRRAQAPKPPAEELERERVADHLKRWERKLKLAQTKVRRYRRELKRAERQVQAASRAQ